MASTVILHGHHLCQAYRRLRFVAMAQGVLAVAVLPFVILTPRLAPATVTLVVILGAYAAVKGYVAVKYERVLKQLRLEERFLRDLPRGEQLVALLTHDHHLWSHSRLWMGLRALLLHPLPHLLLVDEKRRRIERHFHRAMRDPQPRAFNWHALIVLGVILLWDVTRLYEGATGGAFLVTGGILGTMLALEALQSGMQWALGSLYLQLEKALCDWTFQHRFEQGITSFRKHYVHRLLYHSRPWFLSPGTRTVERSVSAYADSTLREVA
ncbi:MAG TPA: hypothetical protein VF190_07195 [Rhodothermales bacterium]